MIVTVCFHPIPDTLITGKSWDCEFCRNLKSHIPLSLPDAIFEHSPTLSSKQRIELIRSRFPYKKLQPQVKKFSQVVLKPVCKRKVI